MDLFELRVRIGVGAAQGVALLLVVRVDLTDDFELNGSFIQFR